ncbi:MAG: glutathione S-transferase N-terminal domain-containing protein [Parvularculales bacterium]
MIPHEAEFELYHYGESLCSQMVRLALEEKQIAYKSHHMHLELTGENLSRAYKKINPNVVVPVLVHNGTPIYNSWEILRYLDDYAPQQGTPLLPKTAEGLAALDSLVHENALRGDVELGENFGTSIAGASTYILANILKRRPVPAVMWDYLTKHPDRMRKVAFCVLRLRGGLPKPLYEKFIRRLARGLADSEQRLSDGRDYMFGDYSLLDVMMTSHFHRLEDVHLDMIFTTGRLPYLTAYWQRVRARPSYEPAITGFHSWEWRAAIDEIYKGRPSPFLPLLASEVDKHLAAQKQGKDAA